MGNKSISGYKEKQFYRNERFTKGTISTNDPLFEGSFRRLINFKISNQNASIENRDPFLTVPFYNLKNEEVKISTNAFVFNFADSTEYAYIVDFNQIKKTLTDYEPSLLIKVEDGDTSFRVIDGDTFSYQGQRHRLAYIDTPELDDETYVPINFEQSTIEELGVDESINDHKSMGRQSKAVAEKFFSDTDFYIVQYQFQSEKSDSFGRKIVFVIKVVDDVIKILNIELLRYGLAIFYNTNKSKNLLPIFKIPATIKFLNEDFSFFNEIKLAYLTKEDDLFIQSAYSSKYTDSVVELQVDADNSYYSKVLIHKMKKETDLKQLEDGTILKRILQTFEINELEVKKDLQLFADESLKYVIVNKNFSVINGKYADQYLNFYVMVYDKFENQVYRGLAEITHTPYNYELGLNETFNIKTYKNPDAHIEIQNITNSKPNIADENSFIPETLVGTKANVRGYSSPSVNAVLLNINLNTNLELPTEDETYTTKFFNTDRAMFSDIKNYNLTPFFKAPLLDSERDKYMFRWDFISLNEIDLSNSKEVEEATPFFRSAWSELVQSPNDSNHNISTNKARRKIIALDLNNFGGADEYYFIRSFSDPTIVNTTDPIDIENTVDQEGGRTLREMQDLFNNWLETVDIDQMETTLKSGAGDSTKEIVIRDYYFQISQINDTTQIIDILGHNNEDSSISYDELYRQEMKSLNRVERRKIFEITDKPKKVVFIFAPLNLIFNDDGVNHFTAHALETKGVFFNLNKDKKQVIPYNIRFGDLYNMTKREDNPLDLDFNEFFKSGFVAVFYLYNYKSKESLTEVDEYYDNICYKRTSFSYAFRNTLYSNYYSSDFIDDKLDKESYMIKYCKYITPFEDKIIVYGNSQYKNAVFISEEGAPYYFALDSVFEFDYEVVHVQVFKTIVMVFTINDIWVIYRVEKTDEFGVITVSWRIKKVLYNISTEVKNKPTIKNITRYVTLMSNNVLYLIKPSTYISDDTEFYLNILSQNIDAIVKDPLAFIKERLKYHGIFQTPETYEMNLNATDNFIKLYYTVSMSNEVVYTLILTYDILNQRWYEEDTCSFGYPNQIYLLDSTTKYEMLTQYNNQLYITYNTDKYKNMMLNEFNESYYDKNAVDDYPIRYYIDSGYLKLNEHLRKRFKYLQFNIKNIDSKQILFTYNFTIDDRQFENNFEPTYITDDSNVLQEIQSVKELVVDVQSLKQLELEITKSLVQIGDQDFIDDFKEKLILNKELDLRIKDILISEIGTLNNFLLDFSNLEIGDIMTVKQNLLGIGRLPRIQMGFTSKNRFYILSFGVIYSEHGGK